MTKTVIVNADDLGLTDGVNRAIMACHERGSVSSATLLVNARATESAAELAAGRPRLGVGLHFNLTLGTPVAPAASLRSLVGADGCFTRRGKLVRRALRAGLEPGEIDRELEAQALRFESLGLAMTHVDSHQHVHMIPVVFDAVARFCEGRRLPVRVPWVCRAPQPARLSWRKRLTRRLLARSVRKNARRWRGRLAWNAGFASVFDLTSSPGGLVLDDYVGLVRGAGGYPMELMVHPAEVDDELARLTGITGFSAAEHALLSGRSLAEPLDGLGLRIASYRDAFAGAHP